MKRYLLGIFVALSMSGFSQSEEATVEPPVFGIGMNLTQFQFSDLYGSDLYGAPANKLMITVTPIKMLRIEPDFGFMSFKYEDEDGTGKKFDLKSNMVSFGAGAFGMMQRGKTNFYGGLRFELAKITDEYLEIDWMTGAGSVKEYESSRTTLAPTIGGEYFLGQHFSIGAEFSLRMMNINMKQPGASSQQEKHTTTGAGLQMRFYL